MAALAVLVLIAAFLAKPWLVMLLIGALHSEVPQVPTVGFTAAWILVLIYEVLAARVEVSS